MTRQLRHLLAAPTASFQQPALEQVSSDFVVILAALLCALICFLGLVAMARCAWLRRLSDSSGSSQSQQQQPADKGLKKKVLRSLPTQPYSSEFADADCAICLAEFAEGDELRVLPPCGHGFHVACIDTWLGSHSSCPSCRHVLVVGRCSKCGKLPPVSAASGSEHVQSAATAPFLP